MLLKRLELIGFKSFANKTVLEFPKGVTAIVGPNGSGKSNVIDALRWILGERDAKKIRAAKSENLIFAGTDGKTRAGFAEATIIFDNRSNFFPVDFSEVSVRRRVTRSGTSSYYLNDSEVRLKDIVNFFSQARMGTKGFSIINQGNSDMFIRASETERRVMLEEVLGLRQYHIKRHNAELKLKRTEENLFKARSLTEELLPHLRMLRRQVKKWEKHDDLIEERKNLEATYFGAKLFTFQKERVAITPQIEVLNEEIKKRLTEQRAREEELQKIENAQPKNEDTGFTEFKKKQQEILSKRSSIQKDLGRLEAELEFILNRPKVTAKEADLLHLVTETRKAIKEALAADNLEGIKGILKSLQESITRRMDGDESERKSEAEKIEVKKEALLKELHDIEQSLTELGTREDTLTEKLQAFNKTFKEVFGRVEEAKRAVLDLEAKKRKLEFEVERISMREEELAHQATQFGRNLSEYTPQESTDNLHDVESRLLRVRGMLASIGEIDPEVVKEAEELEERYAFLTQQITDLEKAAKDLKNLILELKATLHEEFKKALANVNDKFTHYFQLMFRGGKAHLTLVKQKKEATEEGEEEEKEFDEGGLEIKISIPRKNIKGLDMLSGGERSLVSIAVLFALISVSPPPFLVLDEVDAALDEHNTRRFAELAKEFAEHSQFIVVTHNRATMSAANVLYGVTMGSDGTSKLLSINLEEIEKSHLVPEKP